MQSCEGCQWDLGSGASWCCLWNDACWEYDWKMKWNVADGEVEIVWMQTFVSCASTAERERERNKSFINLSVCFDPKQLDFLGNTI